jgi:transcription antitermination factor NusG
MRELRANTDLARDFSKPHAQDGHIEAARIPDLVSRHERAHCAPGGGLPGEEWFAITVKHQHEATVRCALDARHLHSYAPTYGAMQRWSDRVKRVERPLFPGYVFCQFSLAERRRVLSTPGVCSIISFGSQTIPIPVEEIAGIKRMLAAPYMLEPWPFLQAGQRVSITAGPLAGLSGIFERREEGGRLIVGIEILRRSVAVHFEASDLVPVDHRPFFVKQ